MVGMAVPLAAYEALRKEAEPIMCGLGYYCGPEIIIDTRLKHDVECYYDRELWKKRSEEQAEYDARNKRKIQP